MYIKNRPYYLFYLIVLTALVSGNIKDLTYPGYNRLYYHTNYESNKIYSLDRIIAELSEEKQISIKTDFGNKYTVELQLNSTVIIYKNGSRSYSTNK